jgi:hypothetical protein
MKIKGIWETRKVWIDGEYLDPINSQKVYNHSPDGHCWSYSGSGPSQLALSILLYHFPKEKAIIWYQEFKRDVIANLPATDFELDIDLDEWIKTKQNESVKI